MGFANGLEMANMTIKIYEFGLNCNIGKSFVIAVRVDDDLHPPPTDSQDRGKRQKKAKRAGSRWGGKEGRKDLEGRVK